MAWRSSGSTNAELIANLRSNKLLKTPRLVSAFNATDRAHYVPKQREAYSDSPQFIGHGATISAPHMHVLALENLEQHLQEGDTVLDVGHGSGYLLALMDRLVGGPEGKGYCLGIEHMPELVDLSLANLSADGVKCSTISPSPTLKGLHAICADGRAGAPPVYVPEGGWKAIHVGAAARGIPPALVEQLGPGGRMFIPVEDEQGEQAIWQVDKEMDGEVKRTKLFGVRYVPLTSVDHQRTR